ncbi:glycosyltransferase [Paraburkholderia sp. LEh10]|uniref:glycosyltransferase n=1 Tax=Paraburkholderia sp. LEh10 TaxID=2821353 RepID=UPI001AE52E72|nr:glycosyltransferase [Paraburkholderia sp. LEh10]MBP0595353.1 glycosyltransferase [Paraburkholderia sp. LEh10]
MRVLHFYRTYLPDTIGGAEQSIYHLCRAGADIGVENKVLTLTRNRDARRSVQLDGHEVERVFNRMTFASVELSWRALQTFDRLAAQADVIHYHFPWPMADIAHLVRRVDRPSIVTYHADIQRQKLLLALYRPLMRRFLASVDRIVATSPNYVATSDVLRAYPDKIEVVPLGLGRAYYPSPDEALMQTWRERIGTPFFLFVGVFRYYKGLPVLIEAMKRTGYPVVFVGDGPLGSEIRSLAVTRGVTNAHFTGVISEADKMALIKLSRAMVFPSPNRAEAFGMSLLESAMLGKPMISCEIGTGTSYVNLHEETGLVVPPNDPDALANAMRRLWQDDGAAEQMGRRAALRFEDRFSAHRTAQNYRRIYEAVIAEHGATTSAPAPRHGQLSKRHGELSDVATERQ